MTLRSFPVIDIFSKPLTNVKQIGIEFHGGIQFKEYASISKYLVALGFKLISWDSNLIVADRWNPQGISHAYTIFEVVFRKTELIDCD